MRITSSLSKEKNTDNQRNQVNGTRQHVLTYKIYLITVIQLNIWNAYLIDSDEHTGFLVFQTKH